MKVIISISDEMADYEALKSFCDEKLKNLGVQEIFSDIDKENGKNLRRYIQERGYKFIFFATEKDKSTLSVVKKNTKMTRQADVLIISPKDKIRKENLILYAKRNGLLIWEMKNKQAKIDKD